MRIGRDGTESFAYCPLLVRDARRNGIVKLRVKGIYIDYTSVISLRRRGRGVVAPDNPTTNCDRIGKAATTTNSNNGICIES